jgi:hypothetical protein
VPASAFTFKISDPTDKALSAKCTHFLQVKVTAINGDTGSIIFLLKKARPEWVGEYNHNDAENAEKLRNRTYGLSNIVAGMEDAYREKEPGFFFRDLKLSITKKQ